MRTTWCYSKELVGLDFPFFKLHARILYDNLNAWASPLCHLTVIKIIIMLSIGVVMHFCIIEQLLWDPANYMDVFNEWVLAPHINIKTLWIYVDLVMLAGSLTGDKVQCKRLWPVLIFLPFFKRNNKKELNGGIRVRKIKKTTFTQGRKLIWIII